MWGRRWPLRCSSGWARSSSGCFLISKLLEKEVAKVLDAELQCVAQDGKRIDARYNKKPAGYVISRWWVGDTSARGQIPHGYL